MIKKIFLLILIFFPFNSHGLIKVDITRGNLDPLPLAVSPLAIDEESKKQFEKILSKIDVINSFSIGRFNKDFIFYELIFNGTPKSFINIMKEQNFNFDTQNKTWVLK